MVQRTIIRLALPGGKPRPKPGPYHGEETGAAKTDGTHSLPTGANGSARNVSMSMSRPTVIGQGGE